MSRLKPHNSPASKCHVHWAWRPFVDDDLHVAVGESIAAVEKKLILATLKKFDGDKPRAAAVLGISLKTLYNRLHDYARE